jgi:CubicO group peptidase (beta-lactamase class C family)
MLAFVLAVLCQLTAVDIMDRVVEHGIADGVFPGAVAVVGTGHRVLAARGYGHFSWSDESAVPHPDSSLFDLASLTKVVATTPAAMLLVQEGKLQLDRPVQAYLPEFTGAAKERVTVRHLLEHRSGLRAFLPLHERASSAEEARTLVLTEPLRYPPGSRTVYSDLNAMLLGWVVEQAAGEPLDSFVRTRIHLPLGMAQTRYVPPRDIRRSMVPVGLWRGHVIAGELHDQNAVRLGGVSGHAGLYSTGQDLARFAQMLLRAMEAESTLLRAGVVRHFTRRRTDDRALGWELRDTTGTDNTGRLLSPATFGHTGFTGTSLWIDPEQDLFVILLTNRVFAPRTRSSITKLKRIRGELADAAVGLKRELCAAEGPVTCE